MRRAYRIALAGIACASAGFYALRLGDARPAYSETVVLGLGVDGSLADSPSAAAFADELRRALSSMTSNADSIALVEYSTLPPGLASAAWGGMRIDGSAYNASGDEAPRVSASAADTASAAAAASAPASARAPRRAPASDASAAARGSHLALLDCGISLFDFQPFYSESLASDAGFSGPGWERSYLRSMLGVGLDMSFGLEFAPEARSIAPADSTASRDGGASLSIDLAGTTRPSGGRPLFRPDGSKGVASLLGLLGPLGEGAPAGESLAAAARKELLVVSSGYDTSGSGTIGAVALERAKMASAGVRSRVAIVDPSDSLRAFRDGGRPDFFASAINYYMALGIAENEASYDAARRTIRRIDLGTAPLELPEGLSYDPATGTLVASRAGAIGPDALRELVARRDASPAAAIAELARRNCAPRREARRPLLDAWAADQAPYDIYSSPSLSAVDPADWKELFVRALAEGGFLEAAAAAGSRDYAPGGAGRDMVEAIARSGRASYWSPALSSRFASEALGIPAAEGGPVAVAVGHAGTIASGGGAPIAEIAYLDARGRAFRRAPLLALSPSALAKETARRCVKSLPWIAAIAAAAVAGLRLLRALLGRGAARALAAALIVAAGAALVLERADEALLCLADLSRLSAFASRLDGLRGGAAGIGERAAEAAGDIARAASEARAELAVLPELLASAAAFAACALASSLGRRAMETRIPRGFGAVHAAALAAYALVAIATVLGVGSWLRSLPAGRIGDLRGAALGLAALGPPAALALAWAIASAAMGRAADRTLASRGYRRSTAPAAGAMVGNAGSLALAAAGYLSLSALAALVYLGRPWATAAGTAAAAALSIAALFMGCRKAGNELRAAER